MGYVGHHTPYDLLPGIFLSFIPQITMAFGFIYYALGTRQATLAILAHPALILTPAFSLWTFGNDFSLCTIRRSSSREVTPTCTCKKGHPQLRVSFRLTWINALMTIIGCLVWISRYMYYGSTFRMRKRF